MIAKGEFERFARWALPLRSNTTRGIVAEWLVARAVGADISQPRDEWADHDVVTPDGVTIEVKAAAYVQSWNNPRPSPITYNGLKARWLTADGQSYTGEPDYRSQVYVFAAHTATTPADYAVWNLDQWEFRVLPRAALVALGQSSIRLSRLRTLGYEPVPHARLAATVEVVAATTP